MRDKLFMRSAVAMLFVVGYTVAQAGTEPAPATGLSLREAALAAARQGFAPETAFPATVPVVASSSGAASDPLSYTFKLGNAPITLDFCSGAHLLMTNSLDPVTELVEHP